MSQVLDRGAQADVRGTATLLKLEKNNSANVQRKRVNITGFICAVPSEPSRRCAFGEFESLAEALRRRLRMFQPLLRRLRLRHKTSSWASDVDPGVLFAKKILKICIFLAAQNTLKMEFLKTASRSVNDPTFFRKRYGNMQNFAKLSTSKSLKH